MSVLLILWCVATTLFIYDLLGAIERKVELGKVSRRTRNFSGKIRKKNLLLKIAPKLMGWYGNQKEIKARLAKAGNPELYGSTLSHFYAAKLVLPVLLFFSLGDNILAKIIYAIIGFFGPDVLIAMKIRKRKQEILEELPIVLEYLKKTLSGGIQPHVAFAQLPNKLKGPLKEEIAKTSAYYNLTMDLPNALDILAENIGLEEIDSMVLALKQSEQTGRIKKLLEQQYEVLRTRKVLAEKRSISSKSNFLPLISVMVVFNILILILTPMLITIFQEDFLAF